LLLGRGRKLAREVSLRDTTTGQEFRVDFFRQNYGTAYWDLIELKSPQKPVVVNASAGHPAFSAEVQKAISQAHDYRELIDRDPQLRASLEKLGIRVYRPTILIVAGRDNSAVSPERLRELYDRIQHGSVEFKTYDDLYRFAKENYEASGLVVVPSDVIVPARKIVLRQGFLADCGLPVSYTQALEEDLALMLHEESSRFPRIFVSSSWRGSVEVIVDLDSPTSKSRAGRDVARLTESGAMALSLGVVREELGLRVLRLRQARTGTGYSLFLVPKELKRDTLGLLEDLWRVEISGLRSSGEEQAKRLISSRVERFQRLSLGGQTLIAVVDFGARRIELARYDFTSQLT
jgi:hypothetical protein